MEDPDSAGFYAALPYGDDLLTVGAEKALVKRWRWKADEWQPEVLWEGTSLGHLHKLALGDVTGNGDEELVIATYNSGTVLAIDPDDPLEGTVIFSTELTSSIHALVLADFNGDGTKSVVISRNAEHREYPNGGAITVHEKEGLFGLRGWQSQVIDSQTMTHARRLLAADTDGDGRDEIYALYKGETVEGSWAIAHPVELVQFVMSPSGKVRETTIAVFDDLIGDALVAGDFDGNGQLELMVDLARGGIYHIEPPINPKEPWTVGYMPTDAKGFQHPFAAADLDRDGIDELYEVAQRQKELRRYDRTRTSWDKTVIARGKRWSTLTWAITAGEF